MIGHILIALALANLGLAVAYGLGAFGYPAPDELAEKRVAE